MLNTFTHWRLGAVGLALAMGLALQPAQARHTPKHKTASSAKAHSKAKATTKATAKSRKSTRKTAKARAAHQQTGVASWYGGRFQGRLTANGERYNKFAMTAAHKTIPFGTWVEVTALRTGRSVRVRINDRGPYVRGRVIDLSRTSARKLGVHGVARVRLNWPVSPP